MSAEDREVHERADVGEADARETVVRRYLATHGPVTEDELERRLGWAARPALLALERAGTAVAGEFTRGRQGLEWIDARALEEVHRASLAKLRREIEPRTRAEYERFRLRWHGITSRDRGVADVLEQLQGVWLPVETWERDVLPARVAGYTTALLDEACGSGEFVWLARRTSDAAKPRVALFRRDLLHVLGPLPAQGELGPEAAAVREALRGRGASFATDLARTTALGHDAVTRALWDLVFAGLVTNDGFAPLRNVPKAADDAPRPLTERDSRRASRWRSIRQDRASAGRWSLVPPADGARASDAERAEAWADLLLARHGVVAYEHAAHEEMPVAWGLVSDALKLKEMRGQARRGSFVEGSQTLQYAHRTAVERLRETSEDRRMILIAATDPANAYGAALPTPYDGFARIPGAYLVLEGGEPVMRIDQQGKRVVPIGTLADERLAAAVATLPHLLRSPAPYRGRRLEVLTYDDRPAGKSDASDAFARLGFEPAGDGLVLWPSRAREAATARTAG